MDIADRTGTSTGLPPVIMVHSPHPHAPSFAYSVFGWSDEGEGLIAFAPEPDGAAELVNGVLRREPGRMMGDVAAITTFDGPMAVRVVPAAPDAAARYAFLRAEPDRLARYLQVVPLADRKRSFEMPCDCCPDLSRTDTEWPVPFDAAVWDLNDDGRLLSTLDDAHRAARRLLPVQVRGTVERRFERVATELLEDGRVRLLQAPAIGDWTSAGAIHALAADGSIGERLEPGLPQFGVALERYGLVSDNLDAKEAAMARLEELPGIAVTTTGRWLTVAAGGRHAARARSILRRLVRDGFAHEIGSYSQPEDTDGCCARCGPRP